jgi:phage gp37-like protein
MAIEDHVLALMRTAVSTHVRACESLPGPWTEQTLRQTLRSTPGVYLAFDGGPAARSAGDALSIASRWWVYVVTAHASGERARRRGDGLQIGAYELLEVLAPLLHGHVVPDAGAITVDSIDNAFADNTDAVGVAIYAIGFTLPLGFVFAPELASLDRFETFGAAWDVPPHASGATHAQWLVGNHAGGTPDARDQVSPPQ